MSSTKNETGRNIISVIAGVIIAAVIFMLAGLILLLNLASKVKGHGEESDFNDISGNFSIAALIITFSCCFLGGYVTGRISTKKDLIHGAITGLVLTLLLAYISDFSLNGESITYYLTIIPFTLLGTLLAIWFKKRKTI
ncbi:MAG: TIGR04086 family membrane protein [Chitinophagaceae bacterium]